MVQEIYPREEVFRNINEQAGMPFGSHQLGCVAMTSVYFCIIIAFIAGSYAIHINAPIATVMLYFGGLYLTYMTWTLHRNRGKAIERYDILRHGNLREVLVKSASTSHVETTIYFDIAGSELQYLVYDKPSVKSGDTIIVLWINSTLFAVL